MPLSTLFQIVFYYAILTVLAVPVGLWLSWCLPPQGAGSSNTKFPSMNWKAYASCVLTFSLVCLAALLLTLRYQNLLPFNSQGFEGLSWGLAFNTAASFVTNTNWQAYGGETTMSGFSQTVGLSVQNFVSAAVGLSVMAALIRGLKNNESGLIGNFWRDLNRVTFYFLVPLSIALSILLIQQGVPQTTKNSVEVSDYETKEIVKIPLGFIASQVAIKQLGTNGGGFFNVNSAHPLENPTPLSNLYQLLAILLIPAACCHAFGHMIGDRRQGWTLYGVMLLVSIVATLMTASFEQNPNSKFYPTTVSLSNSVDAPGGNMEGKEARFGIAASSIWAIATTAASNGSVNSMHDSFTPLGGLMPMVMMQLGEVIFGGVGSGLYGMLAFVIVTVFIAGLMVGRTPEYLGKKIEVFEMKMVSLIVLVPCILVLVGVALTVSLGIGGGSVSNPGPHGFSQILYAYSSIGNNNGSAFAGFSAGLPFHLWFGGFAMILSRFLIIVPILALAGSIGAKKITPPSAGTLPTHTLLFSTLLVGIILIVGALTFVPALVLGPIVEHLM